jgi:glyoxylase-like metal-dependent hydrolase (beta-lactamase superfamily II)
LKSISLLLLLALNGFAQTREAVPLHAELVKTGLYLIPGGGCNSLLRLSADGLIIVDGKLPGNYSMLMRQAQAISNQPVRALINTDSSPELTGTNTEFLEAGTQILAQENVSQRLGPNGGPTKTFDTHITIKLGGIEVQVEHYGNGRTNGDSVVYFPNLKVVAIGDLFTLGTPQADYSAGGSLVNWAHVLSETLKLDFDTVVPSTGTVMSRADLEAFKAKLDTVVAHATELVKNGVSKDQLMSRLNTNDLGWQFDFSGVALDRFYAELQHSR